MPANTPVGCLISGELKPPPLLLPFMVSSLNVFSWIGLDWIGLYLFLLRISFSYFGENCPKPYWIRWANVHIDRITLCKRNLYI